MISDEDRERQEALLKDKEMEIQELKLAGVEVADHDHGRNGLAVVLSTKERMSSIWNWGYRFEVNTRLRGRPVYDSDRVVTSFDEAWDRAKKWVLDDELPT